MRAEEFAYASLIASGRLSLVISLKQSMEQDAELLLRATLDSYHAALDTVGEAAAHACPPAGEGLQAALLKLSAALSQPVSQSAVVDITRSVQDQLKSWSEHASKLFEQRASDVQEVLLMAGTAAQQVGERGSRALALILDEIHVSIGADVLPRCQAHLALSVQSNAALTAGCWCRYFDAQSRRRSAFAAAPLQSWRWRRAP